jgi:hypothetical protein
LQGSQRSTGSARGANHRKPLRPKSPWAGNTTKPTPCDAGLRSAATAGCAAVTSSSLRRRSTGLRTAPTPRPRGVGVYHRGTDVPMTEQLLCGADVRTVFEQVRPI